MRSPPARLIPSWPRADTLYWKWPRWSHTEFQLWTLDKDRELNKVVARMADGRLIKGMTADFVVGKNTFHIREASAPAGSKPLEVNMKDLKGLFFVKDYAGDKQRAKRNEFDPKQPNAGRRIQVVFKDGEILLGTTTGYQPGRPGFFVVPADSGSNMERCYVITAATKEVKFL